MTEPQLQEFAKVKDAIKAIKEDELSRVHINFSSSLSSDERKSEIQSLSDFISTNPPSLDHLDFSESHVPEGNVAALSKEELAILRKGLEKNIFLTGVSISNYKTYETFAEEPHVVDVTGCLIPQHDKSKIKDEKKHHEYQELRDSLLPDLNRNNLIADCTVNIAKAVLGGKLIPSILADNSISDDDKKEIDLYQLAILRSEVQKTLYKGLSAESIKALSHYWHQPAQQAKMQKLTDYDGVEWQPIFGQKDIDIPKGITGRQGWKIFTLTNATELNKEGQDLKHCVGGYTSQCLRNSHIVSVRNPQGNAVSTFEFATDYDKRTFEIRQHYGENNKKPKGIPIKIEKEIRKPLTSQHNRQPTLRGLRKITHSLFKINNKTLDLNIDYHSLHASQEARDQALRETPGGMAIREIGFDPCNPNTLKKVMEVYEKIVAPTGQSVKDQKGDEIPNFDPEVRKELRENFKKLKNLSTIDISPYHIAGKSKFDLENKIQKTKLENKIQKTKKAPHKNINFSDDILIEQMQLSMQRIVPEYDDRNISIGIDRSSNNKVGEVFFTFSENIDANAIHDKMKEIFQEIDKATIEYKKEQRRLQIKGITEKHSCALLSRNAEKLSRNAEKSVFPKNR